MSSETNIEWAQKVWNPVVGCTRASAGCDNCYAVKMTHRLEAMGRKEYKGLTVLNPSGDRHFNGTVRCLPDRLRDPLGWRKPQRVFVNSMSDLFHKEVPTEFIDRVFATMALCPQHIFQVLTKRPERMAEYLNNEDLEDRLTELWQGDDNEKKTWNLMLPLSNVWMGTSVENQEQANKRVVHLLRCPAAIRFISQEPQLEAIDYTLVPDEWDRPSGHGKQTLLGDIDWLIQGGESGPGARPFDIDWARHTRDQCAKAGTAYFLKQLGSHPNVRIIKDLQSSGPGWSLEIKGAVVEIKLQDSKGGNPSEWPKDLQGCREFPKEPARA